MPRRAVFAILCAVLVWSGCGRKKSAARPPAAPAPGWSEEGIASWYGDPYHGRQAANGEIYDMEQMTAAHRTLPFGAMVKVTNHTNGKKVEVRITDRGPFIEGRIIDLSRAAARAIDLIRPGTAPVRIEVRSYALSPRPGGAFAVQVGGYLDRRQAERLSARLRAQYAPVAMAARAGSRSQWRVVVGDRITERDAAALAEILHRQEKQVFVVRLDPSTPAVP
ncbi:MAG TPA: septal ring lytic transglycosylase RlpA family protein [Paludibaculum sp.]|jgi:rare lipoprotein A